MLDRVETILCRKSKIPTNASDIRAKKEEEVAEGETRREGRKQMVGNDEENLGRGTCFIAFEREAPNNFFLFSF